MIACKCRGHPLKCVSTCNAFVSVRLKFYTDFFTHVRKLRETFEAMNTEQPLSLYIYIYIYICI